MDKDKTKKRAANFIGMLRNCPVKRNNKLSMPGGWVEVRLELPFIMMKEIERNSESPDVALTIMCQCMLEGLAQKLESEVFESKEEFETVFTEIKEEAMSMASKIGGLENLMKTVEESLTEEINQDV